MACGPCQGCVNFPDGNPFNFIQNITHLPVIINARGVKKNLFCASVSTHNRWSSSCCLWDSACFHYVIVHRGESTMFGLICICNRRRGALTLIVINKSDVRGIRRTHSFRQLNFFLRRCFSGFPRTPGLVWNPCKSLVSSQESNKNKRNLKGRAYFRETGWLHDYHPMGWTETHFPILGNEQIVTKRYSKG